MSVGKTPRCTISQMCRSWSHLCICGIVVVVVAIAIARTPWVVCLHLRFGNPRPHTSLALPKSIVDPLHLFLHVEVQAHALVVVGLRERINHAARVWAPQAPERFEERVAQGEVETWDYACTQALVPQRAYVADAVHKARNASSPRTERTHVERLREWV